MKTPKILTIICIIALVFALGSCPEPGTDPQDPPTTNPPTTNPPVTEPPVTEPPVTNPPVTEPPPSNVVKIKKDGILGDAIWNSILKEILDAKKYVDLDLSACIKSSDPTSVNGLSEVVGKVTFNPDCSDGVAGALEYIVSLTLPDTAQVITAPGTKYYKNLEAVNGIAIEEVGTKAFENAGKLKTIHFSKLETIGEQAFSHCDSLEEAVFPAATGVPRSVFINCTSLKRAEFVEALIVGKNAFSGCTSLERAYFPKATEIGDNAFEGCTSLEWLTLNVVEKIGREAFKSTGSKALSITLPGTATDPAFDLGQDMFIGVTATKEVTLLFPINYDLLHASYKTLPPPEESGGAANYECWGNGFRGLGWLSDGDGDGTADDPKVLNTQENHVNLFIKLDFKRRT